MTKCAVHLTSVHTYIFSYLGKSIRLPDWNNDAVEKWFRKATRWWDFMGTIEKVQFT